MIGKDVCPTSKKVFEKKDIFIFEDVDSTLKMFSRLLEMTSKFSRYLHVKMLTQLPKKFLKKKIYSSSKMLTHT